MVKNRNSLSERTIKGVFWVFSLRIVTRIFLLTRTIILARLLSPNDFGLFGIALLALSCLETFSLTGFKQAFIQKKADTELYLNVAWTVQLIRGFLIAFILFFIAPYIATFFEVPKAESILRIIGFSIILQGLINPVAIYFEKNLKFHKYFVYQFLGAIADVGVAISAAIILRSVWALVFGLLAGNFVRCIVSYIIEPYKPCIEWDFQKIKNLFGFGKWILGSSILVFLILHGDHAFIGKLLGVTALGFYQMAYTISNMPATEISHVISQVTFPAYSKLQDNLDKLSKTYLKVLQITTFISVPLAGLIFILSPELTKIFLGEKWMPIVPIMQVLVLAGLIRSIAATTGSVFLAIGKPKLDTKLQIIRLLILVTLIYPLAIKWGILGVSIAVVLSILISTIGFSFMIIKITGCRIKEFSKMIVFPLISGMAMILSISILKINISIAGIWEFLLCTTVGASIYLGITYLLDRFSNYGIRLLIKEQLSVIKKMPIVTWATTNK